MPLGFRQAVAEGYLRFKALLLDHELQGVPDGLRKRADIVLVMMMGIVLCFDEVR